MNLNEYLENVGDQLHREGGKRESKVEKAMVELVNKLMSENEATTIKRLSTELNKRPQQIHQVLRKSTVLIKKKVKGFTLVVPASTVEPETSEQAE